MSGKLVESRFFQAGEIPEFTTREWYARRERAPHLEQAGHCERLLLAAEYVQEARDRYGLWSVSDMGAGDGGLLSLVRGECWGYDLQPENVDAALAIRHVPVALVDFVNEPVEYGDITVCTEVLEHMVDPHGWLKAVPSRVVVASSPDGETDACHYEFHAWGWSMDSYRRMFEHAGFRVVRHASFGFQVVLAVREEAL